MAEKTMYFTVDIADVTIQSGVYYLYGLVNGEPVLLEDATPFNGNTFSRKVNETDGYYFTVTVFIRLCTSNGITYQFGDDARNWELNLVSAFYTASDAQVKVSPQSSIATIYAYARMATVSQAGVVVMKGTDRNMKIANGMRQNMNSTNGYWGKIFISSPNAKETNSYPMFNSLCNLFYYCLKDGQLYNKFLGYAWSDPDKPNQNFLQALHGLLHDPFTNAANIYQLLVGKTEIYKDSLTTMNVPDDQKAPNNWTLTIKTNLSGSKNFIPSGTAFVVYDADDNAWVANNFRAGGGDSGTHCLVYQYNLAPAAFSPVQGGGLLGVGFGVAIDNNKEYISFGNFGWGAAYNNPQEGSISRFYYKDGKPLSPSNGYIPGLSRVQGMAYDKFNNLWMASVGCQDPFAPAPTIPYQFKSEPSAIVVYLNGDPANMLICDEFPVKRTSSSQATLLRTPYLKIFDVTHDPDGNAYVSCIGNYDEKHPDNCALSAVYKVVIENNKLVVKNSWYSNFYSEINQQYGYESLRQVTVNGDGDVVVVGVASSQATVLSSDLSTIKATYATNVYAPWGVKIDKKQTVFLANFGPEKGDKTGSNTLDIKGPFGVTMIRDPKNPSSAKLLTVPTGGDEVMLANGQPLYGTLEDGEQPKCYQPIMRLTSTNIDGAGNLWCMNNWKPSALVDVASNPGGDGVVVFLGIAEPE